MCESGGAVPSTADEPVAATAIDGKPPRRRVRPPILVERLPHTILASIFQYLDSNDLISCMLVCRHWLGYLIYEDSEVWETVCLREVPSSALSDPYLLVDVPSWKSKLVAFRHAWNSDDCSRNTYIKLNGFTVHRNPIAQSTDGVRAKRGFQKGRHAWEVWWEGPLGTVAVVGVATRHAALQCPGYVPLLGSDDQGWGWDLVNDVFLHNGKSVSACFVGATNTSTESGGVVGATPSATKQPSADIAAAQGVGGQQHIHQQHMYQVGDKIRVILDCDDHMMYFEKGSRFLGVAFRDLPPVKLFPCICAVYGNTEVTMIYLGAPVDG